MSKVIQEKGNISVATDQLFPIIKKWLYSEQDIFLRELISNSNDAITKLGRLSDLGEYKGKLEAPLIEIKIDKSKKTITIKDNGLGMSSDEIKKYINQIAFSGAKDFLDKYKEGDEKQQIIGHFGMGFFSSFMVAQKVTINSKSWQEKEKAVSWECDGSTSFSMSNSNKKDIGTEIVLHIDKEAESFLDEQKIKDLVTKYSNYLETEIKVNENKANSQNSIWNQQPSKLKDEDYKKLYEELFPFSSESLFQIHFQTDYPFRLKGILYFPKHRPDIDISQKGRLKLFCNNVFVSDNILDIIPPYFNFLQGIIDSPDIPLNVSRSALQTDANVKKIATHIVNKIAEKFNYLFKNERQSFEKYWEDLNVFIKYGCITDEKFFEKLKDNLIFEYISTEKKVNQSKDNLENKKESTEKKDNKNESILDKTYLTFNDYKIKNPKLKDKILYTNDIEKQIAYIDQAKKQGLGVLLLNNPIDNHFIQQIEMKLSPLKFARVDSGLGDSLVDEDKNENENEKYKSLVELFKKSINQDSIEVKIKNLKQKEPSAMIVIPEQMRRMSDMSSMMAGKMPSMEFNFFQFIVNSNNDLIQNLGKKVTNDKSKEMEAICRHIYDIALLQNNSLKGDNLIQFANRSLSLVKDKI